MLEFVLRADSRAQFETLMRTEGFMDSNSDPMPGVVFDPTPGTLEYETGIPIEDPPTGAFHVNVKVSGDLEDAQTAGYAQTDAEGNLLPQYMRTKLGNKVKQTGKPWTGANGRVNGNTIKGVTFIYLTSINSRKRVWQ